MSATDAPPLSARRETVAESVAAAPGVRLCLDFDGTLAPIVDDPAEATLSEGMRGAVARLASRPSVAPAVVSGRALADLRERVALDGVDYAGNHGLELDSGGRERVHPDADRWRTAVDRVCDDLADRLSDVPGCEIEDKGLTATVHVRRVPDGRVDEVDDAVRSAVAAADDDLTVRPGRAILEVRPPVAWDKGRAVDVLADEAPADWLTLYVGDDVTDEDAFEALGDDGIGVLVGDRSDTAADYRLPEQSDVSDLLALIAERTVTA